METTNSRAAHMSQKKHRRWLGQTKRTKGERGARSYAKYSIERGGGAVRKARRWLMLVTGGLPERWVTDEMRERHIHPRSLRRA